MKPILIFLTFFLFFNPVQAEEELKEGNLINTGPTGTCPYIKTDLSLRRIQIKDLSADKRLLDGEIKSDSSKEDLLKGHIVLKKTKDNKPIVKQKFPNKTEEVGVIGIAGLNIYFDDIPASYVPGSYNYYRHSETGDFFSKIKFEFRYIGEKLPKETTCLSLRRKTKENIWETVFSMPFTFPAIKSGPDEQPLVLKLAPDGGVIGDTMTVTGKNFGDNLDNIYVYLISDKPNEEYYYKEKEVALASPFYLSKADKDTGIQTLHFTLPDYLSSEIENMNLKERFAGKKLWVKLMVNYRPSAKQRISLLHKNWRRYTGILSILITIGSVIIMALMFRKRKFLSYVLIDKHTRTYSLVNLQSYLWTIVLMGSYFYVAISTGLILHSSGLPDFNYSLVLLMGISYGGLVGSKFIDRKTEIVKKEGKPEWKDIVTTPEGYIDFPKLQLLTFTLISIAIYLFYLSRANVLNGLPNIPETLHTLLITSQGGYLGGRAVTENYITKKDLNKASILEGIVSKKEDLNDKEKIAEEEAIEETKESEKKGRKRKSNQE